MKKDKQNGEEERETSKYEENYQKLIKERDNLNDLIIEVFKKKIFLVKYLLKIWMYFKKENLLEKLKFSGNNKNEVLTTQNDIHHDNHTSSQLSAS